VVEELSSSQSYCEVCGIDVDPNNTTTAKLKRFGKYFCSEEHMNQYVNARVKGIGIENSDDTDKQEPRRCRFGGCC
jgi:hypothetical protein